HSKLIFIDTYKKSYIEKFYGYDVINVNDLAELDIDEIIILSHLYEEEIYNTIIEKYNYRYQVHRIHARDKTPLDLNVKRNVYNKLYNCCKSKANKIILINTPEHTNIGDHLIAEAAKNFLSEYFPNYEMLEITNVNYRQNKEEIIGSVNIDDIIVITGGGFFGSLWPYSGENLYSIIYNFINNKIIIMPQTIYFEDTVDGENQKELVYNLLKRHRDVTVCLREEISMAKFKLYFGDSSKTFLHPDVALLLNYSHEKNKKEGVILCLRNDKEGCLLENEKMKIENYFEFKGYKTRKISMHWNEEIKIDKREAIIQEKINELKSAKIVITDTLHCMISCAISGTPCIAINNLTKKVEGVYKAWLHDVPYIRFVDSYEKIFSMDFSNWNELDEVNYYKKNFNRYLEELEKLIRT
ncbi:MAG TPA: hypothetical protein GXZ90_00015, partial [Clostridiales bacterium]|nr:hypothetical protein [Clostridiales bacterium]